MHAPLPCTSAVQLYLRTTQPRAPKRGTPSAHSTHSERTNPVGAVHPRWRSPALATSNTIASPDAPRTSPRANLRRPSHPSPPSHSSIRIRTARRTPAPVRIRTAPLQVHREQFRATKRTRRVRFDPTEVGSYTKCPGPSFADSYAKCSLRRCGIPSSGRWPASCSRCASCRALQATLGFIIGGWECFGAVAYRRSSLVGISRCLAGWCWIVWPRCGVRRGTWCRKSKSRGAC
ncbi:MAG: hypothetical protein RL033_6252 [Pseudomonadota bacterium]